MKFTCPCCGFKTLDERGGYDICEVCDWEDDPVQLACPALSGGANQGSLIYDQSRTVRILPVDIREWRGFERDDEWRPLTDEELAGFYKIKTGEDYFKAACETDYQLYWKEASQND